MNEKEQEAGIGGRQGFVLLETPEFDFEQMISELKTTWGMEIEDYELENGNLVFEYENNLMAVSLMETPIPDGEAEYFAQANYMWKEAVETTKKHQAHLVVFTISREGNPIEAACNFTVLVSSCLSQKSVLGIYTTGTVFEPAFYQKGADAMKKGELPVPIWVYVGLGRNEKGK